MASPRSRRAVWVLCAIQFVDVLGGTVVVTALPTMLADFGASELTGSLIVTAYAMFFGGLLMVGARLGHRFGHRKVLVYAVAVFAAACVVAALAPSATVLALARSAQGAAAAGSVPAALRLLTTVTDEGRPRRRAVAIWSAAGAAAGASGFVFGGIATEVWSWRAIFWASALVGAGLIVAVRRFVSPDEVAGTGARLDLGGAVALTVAVMTLVVGTTVVAEPGFAGAAVGLLVAAVVVGVVFVWVERRARDPLVPARAVRSGHLRLGSWAAFWNTATTSSAITLATLYLQDDFGQSALQAAAHLVPFSLAVIVGSSVAAPLLNRISPGAVSATGLGLIAVSNLALATTPTTAAVPVVVAVSGFGIGLSAVASTSVGTAVPLELRAVSAGLLNTSAQLGTAIGVAAIVLASVTWSRPAAWAAAAIMAAAAAIVCGLGPARRPT